MPTALGAYIFAGAFTTGVKRYFDVLAHLEGDGYGVSSARLNWPNLPIYVGADSWPIDDYRDRIDFLYANPPCAIFSPMGIATTRGSDGWRTDPRLGCWHNAFGLLERIRPRAWALESVPQALTTGREVVDDFTKRALLQGYSATFLLVNAQWMGIPQARRRFFLLFHRPARLAGYALNWAPPPTVGEVLAEVPDPGHVLAMPRADLVAALRSTAPGERLADAWERLNPGWEARRETHPRGFVTGRPSFADRRLRADEVFGAYVGPKFFHPTEDRWIGIEEAKALCGYPPDFKLAGPPSGWPSLLARAVMPPVAAFLARAVAATLGSPDAAWADRRVTRLDLREPGIDPVDLTGYYLDAAGRVRVRVRAGSSTPPGGATNAVASGPTLSPVGADRASMPSRIGLSSAGARVLPGASDQLAVSGGQPTRVPIDPSLAGTHASVGGVERQAAATVQASEPTRVPACVPASDDVRLAGEDLDEKETLAGTVRAADRAVPGRGSDGGDGCREDRGALRPLAGEGSGRFIQRLWLAGLTDPDRLVALVHDGYPGRRTTRSDVYYNYRVLLDAGTPGLAPWPAARRGRPNATTLGTTATPGPEEPAGVGGTQAASSSSSDGLTSGQLTVANRSSDSSFERCGIGVRTPIPRLLLTGTTPMQVGSTRTQLKIVTGMTAWRRALELLGYAVDWRPVTVGEDLSGYDRVVVSLHKPNAIVSRHFYGALYALSARLDAVLVVDDWQTHELVSGIATCARDEVRAFRLPELGGRPVSAAWREHLFGWLNKLATANWHWPVVVTVQGAFDVDRLGLPAAVTGIDPTGLIDWYEGPDLLSTRSRDRRWIQASLLVMPEVKTSWPIDRLGNPSRGEGGIGHSTLREAQPRVVEADVQKLYNTSWGMLAPPHKHPGSGWWRPRYSMAANGGTVASGHTDEAALLGEPYTWASDPKAVEGLSDVELAGLAADQKEVLERVSWPRERALEAWRQLLKN